MKLAVEFPSVAYREGGEGVIRLARGIEEIGFDQLDVFDHVVMGYPTQSRDTPRYPPQMPVMEALMLLSYVSSATSKIGIGTEVLVLPQRQPVLVAKQVSTLDVLSGGRVRLGVGVGWQASEYDALDQDFSNRGERMDDAIEILRSYWDHPEVTYEYKHYSSTSMALEPKPPQGKNLPIWIGGNVERTFRRVGDLGNGWLATAITDPEVAKVCKNKIAQFAESAGRNPSEIGYQMMLDIPPTDAQGKQFYKNLDLVTKRAHEVSEWGFEWGAINATAIFQAGYRSIDEILSRLEAVYNAIQN